MNGKLGCKLSLGLLICCLTLLIILTACPPQPPATFTVTYDGNGNTGGSVPTDGGVYAEGDSVTVLGNDGGLVKTGYGFTGWNTATDGGGSDYSAGDTFTINAADVTFYARWSAGETPPGSTYTLTVSVDGAGSVTKDPDKGSYNDGGSYYFEDYDGSDDDINTVSDNDWRLTADAPLNVRGGGLDLSGDFTDDMDGAARTTSTPTGMTNDGAAGWSMGAYEED